mmetsp:Transcript_16553/g.52649  ORF Transcript_16553/g.52649 Transcript_16553/m.52649 type:complete len:185 (+) Transcript_16553:2-556(+)
MHVRSRPGSRATDRRAAKISASVTVSTALVASSHSSTGASLSRARPIATRCFSPPDSLSPRSPTSVSYPLGMRKMASWMRARRAAASTSSLVAPARPYSRLCATVSLKRTTSCGMTPIAFRSDPSSTCRTSRPSMRTAPPCTSKKRKSRRRRVDFPEPDAPTTAHVCPGSTRKETSRRSWRSGV